MTQPFRLGFLTHLEGSGTPQQIYQNALEIIVAADDLGFDGYWIAQHHFTGHVGRMPAPFPFLAAAAERTKRLRLGTSIIILPLETPLRVAEDAAVVDTLSGGRLELGIGSGSDFKEFEAFDIDPGSRFEKTTEGFQLLKRAFRGEPLGENGQHLFPPVPTLVDRLWQSAGSERGAEFVAKNGAGMLLPRAAGGVDDETDEIQLRIVQRYKASWQEQSAPRLGLSRSIYLGKDKQSVLKETGDAMLRDVGGRIRSGSLPAGLPMEEYFRVMHVAYGHPEEAAEMLRADKVLPHTTDLIVQFSPCFPPLNEALTMLEQVATQVAPALGWRPQGQ
ncbi:MAG TPA: LLM class flavin-dependent oxidoreductase [Caldilineaceae bacterium]|nr:LLM class flavin-dependent oxidoreductase [Caldilineaceae bacterium]